MGYAIAICCALSIGYAHRWHTASFQDCVSALLALKGAGILVSGVTRRNIY